MTLQQACTNRVFKSAAALTVLRPNPSHPRTLRTVPLPLPPCLPLVLVSFSYTLLVCRPTMLINAALKQST